MIPQVRDQVVKDAGTAFVGGAAALGVGMSWWDILSSTYSFAMGAGAAVLMIGRLLLMYREFREKQRTGA